MRLQAVTALGRTFSPLAAPYLMDALRDPDKLVRSFASTNLEQLSNYLDEREKWEDRFKTVKKKK